MTEEEKGRIFREVLVKHGFVEEDEIMFSSLVVSRLTKAVTDSTMRQLAKLTISEKTKLVTFPERVMSAAAEVLTIFAAAIDKEDKLCQPPTTPTESSANA